MNHVLFQKDHVLIQVFTRIVELGDFVPVHVGNPFLVATNQNQFMVSIPPTTSHRRIIKFYRAVHEKSYGQAYCSKLAFDLHLVPEGYPFEILHDYEQGLLDPIDEIQNRCVFSSSSPLIINGHTFADAFDGYYATYAHNPTTQEYFLHVTINESADSQFFERLLHLFAVKND